MKLVKVFSVFVLSSLVFISCSTSTRATNVTTKKISLYNSDWRLLGEDNSLVKGFNGNDVNLNISKDDLSANGYAGCNQFTSIIKSTEYSITFGPIMRTEMACPSTKIENSYLQLLSNVNRYEIKRNELFLYKDNILLLKFIN